MASSGIQGRRLVEVTVVACSNLKYPYPTRIESGASPFVWLKHPSSNETRTTAWNGSKWNLSVNEECGFPVIEGETNPSFNEKFEIPLIEGLSTITVDVWNSSSTPGYKEFIARGWVSLDKVLTQGYDDSSWPLNNQKFGSAGEVKLIMKHAGASPPPCMHEVYTPPVVVCGIGIDGSTHLTTAPIDCHADPPVCLYCCPDLATAPLARSTWVCPPGGWTGPPPDALTLYGKAFLDYYSTLEPGQSGSYSILK